MTVFNRVLNFMLRFGQLEHAKTQEPNRFTSSLYPQIPPDDVVRNRCKWQVEETLELLEACFDFGPNQPHYRDTVECLRAAMDLAPVQVDLVAYADANADIRYVAYGNDIAAGIYSPDVDAEVCRSNDSKSPPGPDGKVRKGDGYRPPDIAGVLKEQGWKP